MSTRLKKHTAHNAKPYDRPKTFLQKVASTLHDMFVPSWWMYTSYKTELKAIQDSVAENAEDNVESQQNLQQLNHQKKSDRSEPLKNIYMPEKRPTYSSYSIEREKKKRGKSQIPGFTDNYNEIVQEKTTNLLKNDSLRSNTKLQRKSVQRPILNGDDHSDNSEGSASTSGCSSLISSHQERKDQTQDYGLQITEEALERIKRELSKKEEFKSKGEKRHISVETDSNNHGSESNIIHNEIHSWYEDKIACSNKRARPQPTFIGRKPAFNLSSFGAPSLGESSHSGENCCHSPFYEGKTAFGGASALNRSHMISSMPYPSMNVTGSKLKVKDVSSKKEFDYMSTTAKRILQSLEKMSTPLVDAKKIPTEKKTSIDTALKRQKMNFTTANSTMITNGTKHQIPVFKPPTTGIMIPSTPMIGKNFEGRISSDQILKSKVIDDIKTSDENGMSSKSFPMKTTGKIRARTNTNLHCTKKSNINEVVELPDLPNVPLPIDRLPTFNFKKVLETPKESRILPNQNNEFQFKFSSPIQHNAPSSPQIPSSEKCFTFSLPVNKETDTPDNPSQKEKVKSVDSLNTKYSDEEVIPLEEKDQEKPVEQKIQPLLGFDEKFKPPAGSWECSTCLVRNSETATKCIACESPNFNIVATSETAQFSDIQIECNNLSKIADRPYQEDKRKEENSSLSGTSKITNSWHEFGDKFKPPAGNWSCPTCLISNGETVLKCEACETPKPNQKLSHVEQLPASSFGTKFKPPPGSWECDTCFVQNSSDAVKCIACETSRCTSFKPSDSKQIFTGFKFGNNEKQTSSFSLESKGFNNNNSGFKFGATLSSGLTTTSQPEEFSFGCKMAESRPIEGFKLNTSNFVASSSAFTFGGKSLQTNNESNNLANGKSQFGISSNVENNQAVSFGNKILSTPVEPNKSTSETEIFANQPVTPKSETSPFISPKSPISQAPTVTLAVTSKASTASITPTTNTTTTTVSITTATTTVSMFSFGRPQPISTTATVLSPKSNVEVISLPGNQSNNLSFNFTTPQKVAITDISNRDNKVPEKVETNNQSSESVTTAAVSQKPIVSFPFCSGSQGATSTTNSGFKATTQNNIFTFGASVPFSIVSTPQTDISTSKNPFTPNTTSQVSFSNFGNKLSTTTFSQNNNQPKQGFSFQPLSEVQFGTTKSVPSNNVFRFGVLQDQKPLDSVKPGFTFGASQEQKPPSNEQTQKQLFNFNFRTPQNEQKATPISPDNCFNFNSTKGNDKEKPKSSFNFSFTPSQNIFGTPSTSSSTPNFNFAGNVASTSSPFPFTAGSVGTSQPTRKIKRAVRRSALGPGRREN